MLAQESDLHGVQVGNNFCARGQLATTSHSKNIDKGMGGDCTGL